MKGLALLYSSCQGLELVTVRHYDQETLDRVTTDKDIILQQKTRETARLIVKQR